jgi:hypothetical protein
MSGLTVPGHRQLRRRAMFDRRNQRILLWVFDRELNRIERGDYLGRRRHSGRWVGLLFLARPRRNQRKHRGQRKLRPEICRFITQSYL